ncbi:hypothetical protein [Streptomyces sp. NPDC002346]
MDPIVLEAGGALVSAMATDGWQQARDAVAAWWQRLHPERADNLDTDLETLRAQVTAARQSADLDTEQALTSVWRLQFQQLVDNNPAAASQLRQLLNEHLLPALPLDEQAQMRSVVMKTEARDNARVYMAGRDQHITDS